MNSGSKLNSIQIKIGALCLFLLLVAAGICCLFYYLNTNMIAGMISAIAICSALGYLIASRITKPVDILIDDNENLTSTIDSLRIELDQNFEEVSREKNKLETILTHMADGVIVVDLDGMITHANPAAKTMLKISDEDMIYTGYDEIIIKYDEELILEKLIAKSGNEAISETFFYGGATFSVRYDKFNDEDGNTEGMILIIQDITERNKIENMQVDFIANISHELKTPLTTIKSYTETLLEGGVTNEETAHDFYSIIDSEVDRMNRLVKDLLQLSRLDYKQQKWYKKQEDLVSLVRTAVKKMEMTAKSKVLQINLLFDKDMFILVDMDRDRIEQVILNILSNAIKYTDEKGRIDIEIIKGVKDVKIMIADNGVGIPEKQLSRVFERFFRVDKARSRMMGGTGLGLPISKQIVEEHKGTIGVESRLGQGTKITITLPLAPMRGKRGIE